MTREKGKHQFKIGVIGTILTCVACFTPAAVALLGLLGLAGWTGHLDYVLFPVLGLFLVLLGYGYRQRGKERRDAPGEGGAGIPETGPGRGR